MKKSIRDILLLALLGAAMIWAFETFLPEQPLAGKGDCGSGYIYKDSSAPFEYQGEQNVCKVTVKAGSQVQGEACFTFKFPPASQTDGCYNVNGLGSNSVRVGGGGTSDECKAISHVEFYPCPDTHTDTPPPPPKDTPTETKNSPTETSTPTQTSTNDRTPTETPTNTVTPPSKATGTPTSTPETPPGSPTPPTNTPTDTSIRTTTPTGLVTPPNTLPPPPAQNTGTPPVILPATGVDGRQVDGDGYGLVFGAIMLLMVFVLIFRVWLRNRRDL